MTRLGLAAVVLVAGCAGTSGTYADWNTQIYASHRHAATLDTTNVQESSGVIAGRVNPDVLWTHNDSGSVGPRVWAMRFSEDDAVARDLGYVELIGPTNIDWEDISAGPNNTIYIFDGGDNPPCNRTDKRIHRFPEPPIDPARPRMALSIPCQTIRFEYPDSDNPGAPADQDAERFDCECLMVHPTTGDIYVVTKRNTKDVGIARVYKLPADRIAWNSSAVHVLQYVTDLTGKLGVQANVIFTVTAGDIDSDGRRVLIRRYGFAYEFTLPDGQPFDTIFDQQPASLDMAGEVQGEGICYSRDGSDIISTSEVKQVGNIPIGPTRCPVYVTHWLLANLRVEPSSPTAATVRWDTRRALDTRVDFGTSSDYSLRVAAPAPVTAHAITLTGLSPSTRYNYRVASGATAFPPRKTGHESFFTTPASVEPDFDSDGDVDQADFDHLQKCYSGVDVPQPRPDCANARLDRDDDVDVFDFELLHLCFTGPNIPATCTPLP